MIKLTRNHLLFGSLGLAVLILTVMIAVLLSRQPAEDMSEGGARTIRYEWITPDRLVAPDDYADTPQLDWVPYRPRKERWTSDDVDEHWYDPTEIGIEVLKERIEADVRSILEEVP
ncbi:MAG: hypothetical protein ACLFP4_06410 [Spirochaetales bacterium]